METLTYLLILFLIGIIICMALIWSTQNRRQPAELACVGSATEPEAQLWVKRLRSVGIWADLRHLGGVTALSIELGSLSGYEVWVNANQVEEAREVLGLD